MEFFLPVRKSDLLNLFCKNEEFSGPALGTENEPRFGVDERAADSSRKRLHGGIATRATHLGNGCARVPARGPRQSALTD